MYAMAQYTAHVFDPLPLLVAELQAAIDGGDQAIEGGLVDGCFRNPICNPNGKQRLERFRNYLIRLVGAAGLEPATR